MSVVVKAPQGCFACRMIFAQSRFFAFSGRIEIRMTILFLKRLQLRDVYNDLVMVEALVSFTVYHRNVYGLADKVRI